MGLPEGIPEDQLPQCWSDDVRMNALFAPFRIKAANPESWDMKMKFWSDMLRQWCKHRKTPIVSAADAKFAFQRRGRTSACIDLVVEEMLRNEELAPVSKYQQILNNGPESWVRWGARLAFKPAAFALTAVASMLPAKQPLDNDGLPKASIDSTQRFVLESAVKDQALDLLSNFPPGVERIGTVEELMKNCQWTKDRDTFEVLLGYLVSQGYATKRDHVVKLAEPNRKVSPITETDEALVKLQSAESRLQGDAARLSRDFAAAETDAKAALQIGNRIAAKNHLRRKHKIQQRLDRCESALENVRMLLHQMTDVHMNAEIVDTYRVSSEAMKHGMKQSGLDEDAVHDTMDDLKDVMESYSEVEKALSANVDDFDQAELEKELQELLDSKPGDAGSPNPQQRKDKSTPQKPTRKNLERDFIFDGEERMLDELNKLDIEDSSPKSPNNNSSPKKSSEKKVPVAEWGVTETSPSKAKPSQSWYMRAEEAWNNNVEPPAGFDEIRLDHRIHPGQPLDVDYSSPPQLYSGQFQVQDHTHADRVWLYNSGDSSEPAPSSFQMAPGGERRPSEAWHAEEEEKIDDLERRLKNLRGFDL